MSAVYPPVEEVLFSSLSSDEVEKRSQLDFTNGRASLINGHLFYSPNCRRDVNLPPRPENVTRIRNRHREDVKQLHQPLWWASETAYLGFLAIEPTFYGPLYQELFEVPSWTDRARAGFSMDPQIIVSWKKLEENLERIVHSLRTRYHVSKVAQVIYTALVLGGSYKKMSDLRRQIKRTRNWFSVLMANLSHLIAIALTQDKNSVEPSDVPSWFQYLCDSGWSQAFISGIQSSVAQFTQHVRRVGTFLQILKPHREQYSVEWLCKFAVPVWYMWGRDEVEASKQSSRIARLTPPVHQLQLATTFMSKNPSHQSQAVDSGPPHESLDDAKKPWLKYLRELEERTNGLIVKESPSQRQARLARQAKPPCKKTRVYVWEKNDDDIYERRAVTQRFNEETLAEFKQPGQTVYNAYFNEWNCGDDFVDRPQHNPYLNDSDDDEDEDIYPRSNVTTTAGTNDPFDEPMRPLHDDEDGGIYPRSDVVTTGTANDFSDEPMRPAASSYLLDVAQTFEFQIPSCSEILYDFFGFVPPLPLPTSHPSPIAHIPTRVTQFRSVVGIIPDPQFLNSTLSQYSFEFVFSFANSVPRNELFDLALGNRMPVDGTRRFRYLRKTGNKSFLLDLGDEATVPWGIVTTNVIDTLFLCRCNAAFSDYELCVELLRRGIRFHTVVPLRTTEPARMPSVLISARLSGYEFTSDDYTVYLREREALLRNPRIARAALMRGGIIWRLVVSQVSISEVLNGPTVAATLYHQGTAIPSIQPGIQLWDDALDETELDSLCGLVYCYTGQGVQRAQKSWWPLDSLWRKDVVHSYWNQDAEDIFQKRLKVLESSDAQPLTATQWRTWLRSTSTARKFYKNSVAAAEGFISMRNL